MSNVVKLSSFRSVPCRKDNELTLIEATLNKISVLAHDGLQRSFNRDLAKIFNASMEAMDWIERIKEGEFDE